MELTIYYVDDDVLVTSDIDFKNMYVGSKNPVLRSRLIYLYRDSNAIPSSYIEVNSIRSIKCNGEITKFNEETVDDDFMIYYNNLCVESKLEEL